MIEHTLESIRIAKKLSLDEVADKIGISRQTIRNWENGGINPKTMNPARRLAKLYGMSLEELVSLNPS